MPTNAQHRDNNIKPTSLDYKGTPDSKSQKTKVEKQEGAAGIKEEPAKAANGGEVTVNTAPSTIDPEHYPSKTQLYDEKQPTKKVDKDDSNAYGNKPEATVQPNEGSKKD